MAKTFICTEDTPVVETTAGKLCGMIIDGLYQFFGVEYATAKRFHEPQPVAPWEGVKDATCYGYVCPLLHQETPGPGEVTVPHRYWPMDEKCQNLNIWTTSLDKNAKKPVMFWMHGGGLAAGSSIEQVAYDGAALATRGDVVLVSVNHRLNILGYLDLSPFGEEYKHSANAGHADIIAALQWVHDNIAAFGGDPDNVTVFGQSGGGMKATMLLQSEAAAGLFHKAIIQSGVIERPQPVHDPDATMVKAMMKELGVTDVKELETLPYQDLVKAYNAAMPEVSAQGKYVGVNQALPDDLYAGQPVDVGFTEYAKKVPIMVGSTINEFFGFAFDTPRKDIPLEEARALVVKRYGEENADAIMAEYAKIYPEKRPQAVCSIDTVVRMADRRYIDRRIADGCAPTYSFLFAMDFNFKGGSGAWHCAELPFCFGNTQLVPVAMMGEASCKLEAEMMGAWVAFARTGSPSQEGLVWEPCTAEQENVMVFDRESKMKPNFDHALYEMLPSQMLFHPAPNVQH